MLQVARLAATLLHDSTGRVLEFIQSQHHADGGFVDRAGKPDLYYTGFGIQCLQAIQADVPQDRIANYLATFGDGEDLDVVHLATLARCYTAIETNTPAGLTERTVQALANCRTDDGGWNQEAGAVHGSTYGCFLAVGCLQDLGEPLPDPESIAPCLAALATDDGGYANHPKLKMANTPATAATITLQHQVRLPIDPKSIEFLLGCHYAEGGFFAMPGAPMPDLLSTATALHALSAANADAEVDSIRETCLDYCNSLWSGRGAFYGNWAEEEEDLDVEYTYYGLLALGHLSV
jgi:prenyltransferase beta subunit